MAFNTEEHDLYRNLAELQVDSLKVYAPLTGFCGYVLLIWQSALLGYGNYLPAGVWAASMLLVLGAFSSYILKDRHLSIAGLLLIISNLSAVFLAAISLRSPDLVYFFILPLMLSSTLISLTFFTVLSFFLNFLIIFIIPLFLGIPIFSIRLLIPAASILLVSIGSWLSTHSLHTALTWVWNGYAEAHRNQELARDHQGELRRALKALDEATSRLEHLNHMLALARDQAEEARRVKQRFAQTISHELRTPLNLIIGFAELMAHSPEYYGAQLSPAYIRDLGIVYRNAKHLQDLVDDVLDLARIDAAQIGLSPEIVHPAAVVEEAADTMRSMVEANGLDLRVEAESPLPALWMDPLRIRQVLLNLLNNAVRFTECGSISIRVCRDGPDVVFSVADTGVGIPPDGLQRVFREFEQIRDGAGQGGTGLGLAISREFVLLHGGRIWAESQVGKGSTFYFSLSTERRAATNASTQSAKELRIPRSEYRRPTDEPVLLVATNSPTAAALLKRHLRNFRLAFVNDLAQVRDTAAQLMPQAVIIDQTYTVDGSILGELGSEWGVPTVPIVVSPLPGEQRLREQLRVLGYLIKPVSKEDLLGILRRLGQTVDRVLIVDDDDDFTLYLSRLLEDGAVRRYQVTIARNGWEALEMMAMRPPDLLILDLVMPHMDGFELIQRVRLDERWNRIPIVVVSGQDDLGDRETISGNMTITRSNGLRLSEIVKWLQAVADATIMAHPEPQALPQDPAP